MSIIEKLGITPGPWDSSEDNNKGTIFKPYCISEDGDVDFSIIAECMEGHHKLIAAAPEMLEALIESTLYMERQRGFMNYSDDIELFYRHKTIIQKATGKSWEEIKELR